MVKVNNDNKDNETLNESYVLNENIIDINAIIQK
jgi:hypothetical protein